VAIDGKTAPGSQDGPNTALHTISAYATGRGLCLAQEGVRGKGKEIEGIEALLETLTLKGGIVTMDALGCQTEIARKILERGGDDLLAVKENPPSPAEALREFFDEGETRGYGRLPVSRHERVEKDHGHIETRRALWITRPFLDGRAAPGTLAETVGRRHARTGTRDQGQGFPWQGTCPAELLRLAQVRAGAVAPG
jgi:predicted transposase YbfD/YdcC